MRLALRIAIVVVAVTLGVCIWRSSGSDSPGLAVRAAKLEPEPTSAAEASTQAAPVAPTTEDLSSTESRAPAAPVEPVPAVVTATGATALLRVHVVGKADLAPLAGTRLMLKRSDESAGNECTQTAEHRGRVGLCPTTGEDGWAEFDVESGRAYAVALTLPGVADQAIAPLAESERREIEILVAAPEEFVLYGRLVDSENSLPVPAGMLQAQSNTPNEARTKGVMRVSRGGASTPSGPSLRSEADGRFHLEGAPWDGQFVSASAPGYARTVFMAAVGHSDPTHPLEIRLSPSATLEAFVADASGNPIQGVSVELSAKSYELQQASALQTSFRDFYFTRDPIWSARTDVQGSASVVDLPPGVSLKLVLRAGSGPREEPDPVVLKPGERRRIQIALGTGGVVQGRVIDGRGQPVANQELWRAVSRWGRAMPVLFESGDRPADSTKTDALGRFRFADVALGTWSIGIAPGRQSRGASASGFPAYAEPVEIKTAGEVVELVLRVDADLFLRGTVLDPAGAPAPECFVSGSLAGTGVSLYSRTDKAGAFTLGPLPNGSWSLTAGLLGSTHAPSLPLQAQAGTDGIALRLRIGGSIVGKVVGAAGVDSVDCELTLARTDTTNPGGMMTSSQNGEFKFDGLIAATYVVSARNRSGSIGVSQPIRIEEGQTVRDVEIKLASGATLRLRYEGKVNVANYALFAGGLPIKTDGLERGKSQDEPVPAGAIEVRWTDFETQVTRTQVATVSLGEVREIVWDGTP